MLQTTRLYIKVIIQRVSTLYNCACVSDRFRKYLIFFFRVAFIILSRQLLFIPDCVFDIIDCFIDLFT